MNNLYLNKELYNRKSIVQARSDFSHLVTIQFSENDKYWICSFEQCKVSMCRIKNEFENYLIGLSNREGF